MCESNKEIVYARLKKLNYLTNWSKKFIKSGIKNSRSESRNGDRKGKGISKRKKY